MTTKKWFVLMVLFAFAAVISFFQINSYFADTQNVNWLFWVIGIVCGLAASYCLLQSSKGGSSNDSGI